jgi:hypothetical protein
VSSVRWQWECVRPSILKQYSSSYAALPWLWRKGLGNGDGMTSFDYFAEQCPEFEELVHRALLSCDADHDAGVSDEEWQYHRTEVLGFADAVIELVAEMEKTSIHWFDAYQELALKKVDFSRRAERAEAELAKLRVGYLHECGRCHKELPWTDGTDTEYWCQCCGHDQPAAETSVRWVTTKEENIDG